MELKSIRRRKLRKSWQRRPAGVLNLPKPAKTKRKRLVDSREELRRLAKKFMSENDALMRSLS